ncbi:MAG: 2-hydroxychromene-2-carboxylate isomerase [Pseudomonadota bacterium]
MSGLHFWFSIGSTYSYLTVMRIEKVARDAGVDVEWRPFSVRKIMQEMNNIPFTEKPTKMAYMWRDIERRAAGYGVPCQVPVPYPLAQFDLANRVAVLGREEGWCAAYVQATYRRWFQWGQAAGSSPNLEDSLQEIGLDPVEVIARAESEETGRAYGAATDKARQLDIFGAPTFIANGEMFWGDDRLEDALAWAKAPG